MFSTRLLPRLSLMSLTASPLYPLHSLKKSFSVFPSNAVPKLYSPPSLDMSSHSMDLPAPPEVLKTTVERRVLLIRRVAKVNSGGKLRSISALVIVGNGNGAAGYGLGRAPDVSSAVAKASKAAEKNMTYIPRFDSRTIYSDMDYQSHFVKLKMRNAVPGYGIVANKNIHEICRLVGISDIAVKIHGSMNPMNITKAFFEALAAQRTPKEIAQVRGKRVMDVEMTYYGFKTEK